MPGRGSKQCFSVYNIKEEENEKFSVLLEIQLLLQSYIFERAHFNQRNWLPGESALKLGGEHKPRPHLLKLHFCRIGQVQRSKFGSKV